MDQIQKREIPGMNDRPAVMKVLYERFESSLVLGRFHSPALRRWARKSQGGETNTNLGGSK
jgi:hypothetical protein